MTPIVYVIATADAARLRAVLDSLVAVETVHVIDNTDGGLSVEEYPNAINGGRSGTTRAINAALRHFTATYDAEHCPVILHDAFIPEAGCVDVLTAEIASGAGLAAPMQVKESNPSIVACGGYGVGYPMAQCLTGMRGADNIVRDTPRWVSLLAVALHPGMLCEVGMLDEWLVEFYADVDYCLRATAASWPIVFNPAAVVTREERRPTGSETAQRRVGRQLMLDRWYFDHKWGEGAIRGVS
ncbi:MAG TPA: hypothetical protein PLF11_01315 [Bacillota bacterium]|jgi:hypothetical protein|nr:hypothetical protein [Bacillota bacterium]